MIFWFEYDSGWQRMRPFEMRISYSLYIEALRPVQHFSHEHVALFGMEWWQFLYVLHIYQRTKIWIFTLHLGPTSKDFSFSRTPRRVARRGVDQRIRCRCRRCPLYHAWPAHSLLFPRVAPLLLSCVPGDIVTLCPSRSMGKWKTSWQIIAKPQGRSSRNGYYEY